MRYFSALKFFCFFIRRSFCFLLCVTLTSCAPFRYASFSHQDILISAAHINISDGIDQDEAILLALRLILQKGLADRLYSLEPFKIDKKMIWNKDGEEVLLEEPVSVYFQFPVRTVWTVYFRDKKGSWFWGLYPVIPFIVEIDKDTGEILKWELKKK